MIQLRTVIGRVLETAASLTNAVSAFKNTRIFPLDPDAKPEKSCSLCDAGAKKLDLLLQSHYEIIRLIYTI
jgi:hypothetical protein